MDALDALRSCGLVGASPQVVSSLAFALAHRHAKRDPRSSALVVGRRREAPPLPVVGSCDTCSSGERTAVSIRAQLSSRESVDG